MMYQPPLEAYLWNPRQWQGSRKVQRMDWAERGLYRELMDECYLHGSIPASVEGIADMLGEDPALIGAMWPRVSRCFEPHPDDPERLISTFIEEVRSKQDAKRRVRSVAGQAGNRKRHGYGNSENEPRKCDDLGSKCEQMGGDAIAFDREEGGRERIVSDIDSSLRSESTSSTARAKRRAAKRHPQPAGLSLETPPEIMALANNVLEACPVKQPRGDHEGNRIRKDPGLVAIRLEAILAQVKGVSPEVLVLAWKLYVESAPITLKAPQYFFGDASDQGSKDAANWYPWAKLAYRKLHPSEPARAAPAAPSPSPATVPAPSDLPLNHQCGEAVS